MDCYHRAEVAKLLNIPLSTLKVWERKGLITSKRDPHNNYRIFDMLDIAHICEIASYRNMGLPVSTIRKIHTMSLNDVVATLKKQKKDFDAQIEKLENYQSQFDQKLRLIDKITELRKNQYLEAVPEIKKAVVFDRSDSVMIQKFVFNPTRFIAVCPLKGDYICGKQNGLGYDEELDACPQLWSYDPSKTYLQFLYEDPYYVPEPGSEGYEESFHKTYSHHIAEIKKRGLKPVTVVFQKLFNAYDKDEYVEYYRGYAEVEPL